VSNDEQALDLPTLVPSEVAPAPVSAPQPPQGPVLSSQPEPENSLVIRAWRRIRSEPSLLVTTAYLFVSFIGLWANYWFYQDFQLPILEYMQASDYLVAGLRDPAYALVLSVAFALMAILSAPDLYRRRHPERVEPLRQKWWGRVLFPTSKWLRWKGLGMTPETGATVAVCWGMLSFTLAYVQDKGKLIRAGTSGHAVHVTMAGDSAPLPKTARLLGSSSAFVFLWWPQTRVAEAVPIESIAKLQSLPLREATSEPGAAPKDGASAGAKKRVAEAVPIENIAKLQSLPLREATSEPAAAAKAGANAGAK